MPGLEAMTTKVFKNNV